MWNLPGPGIEPESPALTGRFLTIGPPGKPSYGLFLLDVIFFAVFASSDFKGTVLTIKLKDAYELIFFPINMRNKIAFIISITHKMRTPGPFHLLTLLSSHSTF